jgi:hypothetical protein
MGFQGIKVGRISKADTERNHIKHRLEENMLKSLALKNGYQPKRRNQHNTSKKPAPLPVVENDEESERQLLNSSANSSSGGTSSSRSSESNNSSALVVAATSTATATMDMEPHSPTETQVYYNSSCVYEKRVRVADGGLSPLVLPVCRTSSLLDTIYGEDEVDEELLATHEASCKYPNMVSLRNVIWSSTHRLISKIESQDAAPRKNGVKTFLNNRLENTFLVFNLIRER